MQDKFNTAAPAATQNQPLPALRDALQKTRANLAMVEAARKADWDAVRLQIDAGADPTFQDNLALQELVKDISPKAVALMQDLNVPGFTTLAEFPLVLGASKNNMALVDEMLKQGKASRETVESAAFMALRRGHKDIADRLLPLLPPDTYSDRLLIALLLDDPARYDAAMAVQKAPHEILVHFVNACAVKDHKAMDHMLDKMIAQKTPDQKRPLIMMGLDGILPYEEVLSHLFQSGYTQAIDKYLDHFEELLPSRSSLLHVAAVVGDKDAKLFAHLLEKLNPTENEVTFITYFASTAEKRPHLKVIVDLFPAIADRHTDLMMTSALADGDADAFFDLIAAGKTLPGDNGKRIDLLQLSLTKNLPDVTDYILQNTPVTPELVSKMQNSFNWGIQIRSAELSGDWRFEKDKIFWRALGTEEEADVVKHFNNVTDISPASPYQVELGVLSVIRRGNDALLDHILNNTDWTEADDARTRAHRACLSTPETAEKAALLLTGDARRALEIADLRMMAGDNFAATVAVLEKQGFNVTDDLLAQALPLAIKEKSTGMAEYLLARGITLAATESDVAKAISSNDDIPVLDTLEKWAVREEIRPARLPADLSDKPALFGGTDSPAIGAAYSDQFAKIMAGADAGLDPQLLVTTKDAHGNSVLDILGAHGKLNDVLVTAVWKDRDAASFIRAHTPAPYHAQCDFDSLTARIHHIKLQERGKNRFILKGGPKK